MNHSSKSVERTYLVLTLLNTLAASFIWGINTLFLLDAGLNNTQAFAANAFFTVGQVLFEVPTGIVADSYGRKLSYLLGTVTLALSTLLYLYAWQTQASFWLWAGSSILLGLGFTFFSGATEAWLVDALNFTKFKGDLDSVFAKGQIMSGIAMLTGSVGGGYIAQVTNLGVPYILRTLVLVINFVVAFWLMHDLGFKAKPSKHPLREMRALLTKSINYSLKKPAVKWIILASPFNMGIGIYAFYAMQPYLLKLYGNEEAYGVAGLAAAIVAGAQILGGLSVDYVKKLFRKRTSLLAAGIIVSSLLLVILGLTTNFYFAVASITIWAMMFAAGTPVRQAYLNRLIKSEQRATVLSFDALVASSGGVISQPALGKAADVWSYSVSYLIGAVVQVFALPFTLLARKQDSEADAIEQ